MAVVIPYKPRPEFKGFHNRNHRWAVIVAHRRAGKTVACVNDAIMKAVKGKKERGRYGYIAPFYSQAKQAAWEYLKYFSAPIQAEPPRESELSVKLITGDVIRLFGADNPDALRGGYFDGVIMDEFGDMKPTMWSEVIRPALADRKGWAVFIGTPKGKNDFWKIWDRGRRAQDWYAVMLKASQTHILDEVELSDARQLMTEDQYAQEFECNFEAAIHGAVYGRWLREALTQGRITAVPYDEDLPVHTAWDLGFDDATAVWFWQITIGEIRLIDYYENRGQDIKHYCDTIKSRGYSLGEHYAPHDAGQHTLAAGGRSSGDLAHDEGINLNIVPATSQQNGIEAARKTLERCWFDEKKCDQGIEALRQYQFEFDEDKKTFRSKPRHDWASHGCFIGSTKVLTRYGTYQIMDLPDNGEVLTPCGWKRYTRSWITRQDAPLVEVQFSGGYTVRCTPDHPFATVNGWTSAQSLTRGSLIRSTLTRSRSISMVASIGCGPLSAIYRAAGQSFTVMFGKLPLDLFRAVATFITRMEFCYTTELPILNVCLPLSTLPSTVTHTRQFRSLMKQDCSQPTGIAPTPVAYGTADTRSGAKVGQNGSVLRRLALIVKNYFSALSAKAAIRKSGVHLGAEWLSIDAVRQINSRADVWCLHVPDGQCFSLENGAVVHNSDAFEIIGQVWQQLRTSRPKDRPRFLSEITADEIFWEGESKSRPRERI